MDNINLSDFENICRTCTLRCDVKFNQDNVIRNVFYKLTDIHFETYELPQQICLKCFEKIIDIHEFAFLCKKAHSSLLKCLNNFKSTQKQEQENLEEISEEIKTENKIAIDDNEEKYIDDKLELKQEVVEIEELIIPEISDAQTIDCFEDNLFIPRTFRIEAKNLDGSNVNKNVINEASSNSSVDSADNDAEISKSNINHVSSQRSYKCKNSKSTSKTKSVPSDSDPRPYKCDQCFKSYLQPFGLKLHMRTHSGERPFKCDQCPKSFVQKITLIQHMRTHTGERPYKCEICAKMFSESSNLKKHMRIHSGERLYECNQCRKSFTMHDHLVKHVRVHNNVRLFKCKECLRSFSQSSNLKIHMRIHSGERPYKCDHCLKTFTKATNLSRHQRTHDAKYSNLSVLDNRNQSTRREEILDV